MASVTPGMRLRHIQGSPDTSGVQARVAGRASMLMTVSLGDRGLSRASFGKLLLIDSGGRYSHTCRRRKARDGTV